MADADSSFRVLVLLPPCCRLCRPRILIRGQLSRTSAADSHDTQYHRLVTMRGEHWGVPSPCLDAQFPGCLRRSVGGLGVGGASIAAGQRGHRFISRTVDESRDFL